MSATLSPCGLYRYNLTRYLGPGTMPCLFIMLNPSTADAEVDDPTIRRCKEFAKAAKCDVLVVVNLFAFRATSPDAMMKAEDPIGPENDAFLTRSLDYVIKYKGPIICAWGALGKYRRRDETVLAGIRAMGGEPKAFSLTKDGSPGHPLYLKKDLVAVPYEGRP